ncbi:MAG: PBP1A family penicillin-binding protein [Armatimonadetes bacterium]|nr:PBP1A family penicillin-binding protein [Armatimonadota bacterium]
MFSRTVRRRLKKFLLWVEVVAIVMLGAAVGIVAGAFYQMSKTLPPEQVIATFQPRRGTEIYSEDGALLAKLTAEYREPVKLARIPRYLQDAVIAIEDARFYHHGGFDIKGLFRALFQNIRGGDLTHQGGSTITQQLARNIYLTQQKTVARKIKEILLAVQIERKWTKAQILETYLNQVYFGSGAYGVQAASRVYFNKDVKNLTLTEAATLAGLPQRPTELSPYYNLEHFGNTERTVQRRNLVLQRMADLGKITPEQAKKAAKEPLHLAYQRSPQMGGYLRAKHFSDYIVNYLRDKYGEDEVFKGGLKVVTTLNYAMQKQAEQATRAGYLRYGKGYRFSEVALVCLDPHTGYIRAMVGSVREPYKDHQFNCAVQAVRQPGSAFKFFVYATALEKGWSIYRPISSYVRPIRDGNKWWTPSNMGHGGTYSVLSAFASSINGCAVNTALQVGVRNVVDTAQHFGIHSPLHAYPSIALGSCGVTVLEMANAFGVIPAGGKRAEPLAVLSVKRADGTVLEQNKPRLEDLNLASRTIDGMIKLTRAVVTSGTGRRTAVVPNAHGKTGTTNDSTDVWFVGFTPELATAVWVGNRDNKPMLQGTYGGTVAAPIWADFMAAAVKLNPKRNLPDLPKGLQREADRREERSPRTEGNARETVRVTVCVESQDLARRACPTREVKEFLNGQQPTTYCTLHRRPRSRPRIRPRVEETPNPDNTDVPQDPDSGSGADESPPPRRRPALHPGAIRIFVLPERERRFSEDDYN